jgi:SGNH hydrolase-like domain, acetyltransferase AlgX
MAQPARIVATLSLTAVSVLACEMVLQVADRTSRVVHYALMPAWERRALVLADGRGNPYHREHDTAGYRNANRPGRADVVVLGDSHAYGAGVAPAESWPARVGAYNMALPGHGPGHSLLQLEEALSLRPRRLIVAPYFGNDFVDVYLLGQQRPELLAGFDGRAAEAAEARRPLVYEFIEVFTMGDTLRPPPTGPRAWVSSHIKLYALAREAWGLLSGPATIAVLAPDFEVATAALTTTQRRYAMPIEADGWRTILTPVYRGWAVNDRDPRVRLGFEASLRILRRIHARAEAAQVPLLVVLHPTKESVFWPRGRANEQLQRLVGDEARLRAELLAMLDAAGIAYVDVLPILRAASSQPYFENIDAHPNATGHGLIAAAVADRLR